MLDVTVYQAMCAVDGFNKGKCKAREPDPILPVCITTVEKTLPHLITVVADMIRFQSLTGCRPASCSRCDRATSQPTNRLEVWFKPTPCCRMIVPITHGTGSKLGLPGSKSR